MFTHLPLRLCVEPWIFKCCQKSSSILETRDVYDDGAKLNPSLYLFKPGFNSCDHDDYDGGNDGGGDDDGGDDYGEGTLACEAG